MRRSIVLGMFLILQISTFSDAGPLHDAARKGDFTALTEALEAGEDVNDISSGVTPLYLAARRGHFQAAKTLIDRGANVNLVTSQGTALTAAAEKSKLEVLELLLQNGANPNSETKGEMVLHLAVRQNCLPCVQTLVEAGANVNAVAYDGKTPLHMAKQLSYSQIADYLMAHGVVAPIVSSISAKLTTANVASGRAIFFKHCARCHTISPEKPGTSGPNLWGIVGRRKSSTDFKNYSEALKMWQGHWVPDELNLFLAAPMSVLPGTAMNFEGVAIEAERIDLIGYLETLRDH